MARRRRPALVTGDLPPPGPVLLEELACVWIEVPGLDDAAERFQRLLGLQLRGTGLLNEEFEAFWNVRPSVTDRRWALLGPPGFPYGMVCLVAGTARPVRHTLPRGWDSVELVVEDVDAAAARLAEWPGAVPVVRPFTADLSSMGSNVHRSTVWRMPWGTHLVLTTGITQPAGRRFPWAESGTGPVFEVHLRTDAYAEAHRLYARTLAMPPLMSEEFTSGPVHEAWGIEPGTRVRMSLLKSGREGTGRGAIELQGHPRAAIDPPSGDGLLPGGTVMVTYACADVDAAHAAVLAGGHRAGPVRVTGAGPLGDRRSFMVFGVEGERVHIVEHDTKGSMP
ncbi:hypothetical protein [Microbispora sp. CA-102843]|uniref:hypothetical protein n=1 Tax=Microbispora sp. CA-102843 TaxID=3239952 RepID=UPI003D90421B